MHDEVCDVIDCCVLDHPVDLAQLTAGLGNEENIM